MESNLNPVVVVVMVVIAIIVVVVIVIIIVVIIIVVVVIINTIVSCLQAHNIPLQMSRSGSVLSISGVGRWIDKGLSKLMGGPEQPPHSGPGSSGSTQSEIDPYVAKSKHRRNTSDQHLGSDTPKVGSRPCHNHHKIHTDDGSDSDNNTASDHNNNDDNDNDNDDDFDNDSDSVMRTGVLDLSC